MKRVAFVLVSLLDIAGFHAARSYASSNPDAEACHHGIDGDRAKVAGISDPAKKAEAVGDLKAAYVDEMAGKYADCLGQLKAVEALMQ